MKTNRKEEFQTWLQDLQENLEWRKMSAQIAVNLHYHLRMAGMKQKDFAELLGVSPTQVSKILSGKENLGLSTIAKMQKVLGVNLIEIPDVPKSHLHCEFNIHDTQDLLIGGFQMQASPIYSSKFKRNDFSVISSRKQVS